MIKILIYSQEDLDLILELEKQENEELQQENKILKENAENNDKVVDKVNWENQLLKKENKQLKDNWNKLKEYIMDDINSRNNSKIIEFEDGRKVMEIVSSLYSVMQDKSKTMKEVLNKMQELEQGSDDNNGTN